MNSQLKTKLLIFEQLVDKFPEIRYAGDPILRSVAKKVSVKAGAQIGKRLGEILLRYRETVGYGRGLAAPQIGENSAVFVTFVDDVLQVFINPIITTRSATTNYYREICLSSGLMAVDVERSEWVMMKWIDENGKKQSKKFDGFLARLYQHEEAHLRGILNLDEASEGGIEFALFDPLKEQLRKTQD